MFNVENMMAKKPTTVEFDTPYNYTVETAGIDFSKDPVTGEPKIKKDKNGNNIIDLFAVFKTVEKGIIRIRVNGFDIDKEVFTQDEGFQMALATLYINAGLPYPAESRSITEWNNEIQNIISKNQKVWFLKKKPTDPAASGFWSLCKKPEEKLPELPKIPTTPKTKKAAK